MDRVPIPCGPARIIGDDDLLVSGSALRVGRQVTMTIAEEVFPKMGRYAVEHAIRRLGEEMVFRHRADIQAVVHSFILDRTWAEPIIREEISKSVRATIQKMLTPPEYPADPTRPR